MPIRYIRPDLPEGRFVLEAIVDDPEDGFTLGPFDAADWEQDPDGQMTFVGQDRPIGLRVRSQKGDVLHANDGSIQRMSYRIVRVGPEGAS